MFGRKMIVQPPSVVRDFADVGGMPELATDTFRPPGAGHDSTGRPPPCGGGRRSVRDRTRVGSGGGRARVRAGYARGAPAHDVGAHDVMAHDVGAHDVLAHDVLAYDVMAYDVVT